MFFLYQVDDEFDELYFKGFEWDKEELWIKFIVYLFKDVGVVFGGGFKKKKKQVVDE